MQNKWKIVKAAGDHFAIAEMEEDEIRSKPDSQFNREVKIKNEKMRIQATKLVHSPHFYILLQKIK